MAPLMQVAAMAMAPDASWAVTVSADGTVRDWGTDIPPWTGHKTLPIRRGQPVAVGLEDHGIGRVLWAAGDSIRLYHFVRSQIYETDFGAPAAIRALALSPAPALAAVACDDGTLRTLNTVTGEFGPRLATFGRTALAVAVASDGGPVIAALSDGSIRRYDLASGTSDMVGGGPGVDLVAVTPDGETVIAATADGLVARWHLSREEPAGGSRRRPDRFRELGAAINAIAVDETGCKVLAARDDGTLWLHDLSGGPAVEFAAAAAPPRPPPAAAGPEWWERERERPAATAPGSGWQEAEQPAAAASRKAAPEEYAAPPSLGSVLPSASAGGSMVDEDVRFTVYRPQTLSPGVWASLMVFAHKTDLIEEPGKPPLDPNKQVDAIARAHFGNMPVSEAGEDARSPVFRGARLRITVDLPRIQCNPGDAEFDWWEPVHHVVFRLLARPDLVGSVVRGAVRVWCGPLILGEVSLAIRVTASAPSVPPPAVAESAARYRKIFPSYSRQDRAIVDAFTEVVRTFGDEYLRDVVAIRAGERWRERLPELIEEADVFQLFWSSNSMRSPWCRKEWEHALALERKFFVRPFYWEDPRPADPANGLPPAALDAVEFVKISLFAAQKEIPGYPGTGTDTGVTTGVQPAEPGYLPPAQQAPSPGYAPPVQGPPGPGYGYAPSPPQWPARGSAQVPARRHRHGGLVAVALVLAVVVVVIIAIALGGR